MLVGLTCPVCCEYRETRILDCEVTSNTFQVSFPFLSTPPRPDEKQDTHASMLFSGFLYFEFIPPTTMETLISEYRTWRRTIEKQALTMLDAIYIGDANDPYPPISSSVIPGKPMQRSIWSIHRSRPPRESHLCKLRICCIVVHFPFPSLLLSVGNHLVFCNLSRIAEWGTTFAFEYRLPFFFSFFFSMACLDSSFTEMSLTAVPFESCKGSGRMYEVVFTWSTQFDFGREDCER